MTIDALRTLVLIGGLFFLRILFNKYQLDKFRDELFDIRRELFLLAAENKGGLKFSSKIYKNMDLMFNSMIRFAHDVSFLQALLFSFFNRLTFGRGAEVKNLLIKSITDEINIIHNPEKKDALAALLERYNRAIATYMLNTSVIFFAIVLVKFIEINTTALLHHAMKKSQEVRQSFWKAAEYMVSWRVSKQAQYNYAIA